MRIAEPAPYVNFGAEVSKAEFIEFTALIGQWGAPTWFIRYALERFVEVCEAHPEYVAHVREALEVASTDRTAAPNPPQQFRARIPRKLYDRFNNLFPDYGATSWFLRNVLHQYLQIAQRHPSPEAMILSAVATVVNPLSEVHT